MTSGSPLVSVVLPVLDEEADIDGALGRVASQSYPNFEVLVADGGSLDATRSIVEQWAGRDGRFRLLDNPRRLQSAGLNTALAEARGDYLVRLDGHSFIDDEYVGRCVSVLESTGADVVGGIMVPVPTPSVVAQGIALANRSSWGAGPARFHTGGESGPAETVYLGSFRTDRVRQLGGWSENVGINEDFDLNHRIRSSGGLVWLDVDLEVGYQPRKTYRALVRQYLRYGRSKATMLRGQPDSLRLRQLLPSLMAPATIVGLVGSRRLAAAGVLAHGTGVAIGASRAREVDPGVRLAGSVAAWLMHWAWSIGFWWGAISPFPPAHGGD